MPKIAVVVCAVRDKTLPHTVQSLQQQTFQDWSLLVVDQSQEPQIGDYLASLGDTRIRHLPVASRGLSRARNAAIAASDSDALAFTDDDCAPAPDWLEIVHCHFAAGDADIVFGRVAPPATYDPATEFCPVYNIAETHRYTWDLLPQNIGPGIGANMSIHRRALEQVGPFDPLLGAGSEGIASGEEADYAYRALAQGARILCTPRASVEHTFGARPGDVGRKLEELGNFAVGAVHAKLLMGRHRQAARPYIAGLYACLRRRIVLNLLRGQRKNLGLNRLRALRRGQAHMRQNYLVDARDLLAPKTL